MKPLTSEQFQAIQELSNHTSIAYTEIECLGAGLSQITIKSMVGAGWDTVDQAINAEFDECFPNLEYRGRPGNFYNPGDNTDSDIYFIDFEGETLIRLLMRREAKPVEWTVEQILRQEG